MKQTQDNQLRMFLWTSIIITVVCVVYGLILNTNSNRGTFGDMFGGLTAWFSGLAFAGIIFTILQQKKELEYQREELELTRMEFKTQNHTLKKQRFENTFFNLFGFHNAVIDKLYFQENLKHERHESFQLFYGLLKGKLVNDIAAVRQNHGLGAEYNLDSLSINDLEEFIERTAKGSLTLYSNNFQLYFRSLKQLLEFVDKSELLENKDERLFYLNFISRQMTEYEKISTLYISLLPFDWVNGLNLLLSDYSMLDDLNLELLLTKRDLTVYENKLARNKS